MDTREVTFLDFGSSSGGSLRWASGVFGGKGIGIDIDPIKIEKLKSSGYEGMVADATALDLEPNSVKFSVMMHFLEHLPNVDLAEKIINSAIRVSQDFVFMTGPDFDDKKYLAEKGYKKYFSDWRGHLWHHTAIDLARLLNKTGMRYCLWQTTLIADSNHGVIHPLEARSDRAGYYDPAIDPPKKFLQFEKKYSGA